MNDMEKELTYEEAYGKLSGIVERMSSASVPLDELIKLYEEGMDLALYCGKLLKGYEARLQKLSSKSITESVLSNADEGGEA